MAEKIKLVCLAALAAAGVFALIEAGLLLRDVRAGERELVYSIDGVLNDANRTLGTLDAAAEQLREAGAQANLAAQEERSYFAKTSLEAYKTAAAARLVLVRTDHSLNDVIAPQVAAGLLDTDALMRQTTGDLHSTMLATAADLNQTTAAIAPALANLTRASAAAADTMADPHIAASLANVDGASKEVWLASSNVADTTQHVDEMTVMIEKRLAQMLKPGHLAVNFAERLLGLGAQTYGVVK